jgi:hypothetical protein
VKDHDKRAHITQAAIENIDFMLDNGETLERALQRAGIDKTTYEKYKKKASA